MAVAKVTLNRLKDPEFPDTICEVVYQYKQFSWTLKKQHKPIEPEAWRTAKYAALLVVSGELKNFKAKYYHTTAIRPNWGKPVYTRIQDHVFFI